MKAEINISAPLGLPVRDVWFLYTGDVPESLGRENLMPSDYKEAKELADCERMVADAEPFVIDVLPVPSENDPRKGIRFGADHNGKILYFHLPEGSVFKVMRVSDWAEHHRYTSEEILHHTKNIRKELA
jgi:hypothetical protein